MPVTVLQPDRPQTHQNPSVCFADIPLWERGTNHQPAAHPIANLRRLRRHLLPKEGG